MSIKPKRAKAALPVNVNIKRAGMRKYEIITGSGLRHSLFAASEQDALRRFKNEFYGERISAVHCVR